MRTPSTATFAHFECDVVKREIKSHSDTLHCGEHLLGAEVRIGIAPQARNSC